MDLLVKVQLCSGTHTGLASFVATEHLPGQLTLFFSPRQKLLAGKPLRWLRRTAVEDADDDNTVGMHIHAEFDTIGLGDNGGRRPILRLIDVCFHKASTIGIQPTVSPPCLLKLPND